MWVVSAEMQLPDILQKPPKTGIRGMAHGSISIQEGQPIDSTAFFRPFILDSVDRFEAHFETLFYFSPRAS